MLRVSLPPDFGLVLQGTLGTKGAGGAVPIRPLSRGFARLCWGVHRLSEAQRVLPAMADAAAALALVSANGMLAAGLAELPRCTPHRN